MSLRNLLGASERINVMDVGASCIAEVPVYKALLDEGLAHLNAFEGDERQISKIEEFYGERVTVFNDFLSDGSKATLYLAAEESGMTSILKPDLPALRFFNGFEEFGRIERTAKIKTKRLDDVEDLPSIDFVKMDIQGSELGVLKSGKRALKHCVAIQLEVSWICLYEGQPAFGEVDQWMRRNGFLPHCMLDVKQWSIAPTIRDHDFRIPFNQLLESDIVYVKNPLKLSAFTVSQLKKLALISHYCFHSIDLCVRLMLELIARGVLPSDAHQKYLESLTQQPA
jgi:FkbM family methyltransferase